MKYVTAIVLAAGRGRRLRSEVYKPLIRVNSKPIIIYSLEKFSRHPGIRDIILVVNSENKADIIRIIKKYRIAKIRDIVLGGRERQDSVLNGLKAMDRHTDIVLIHDAVRPFIQLRLVSSLIKEVEKTGAAVLGVPVKATVKSVKVSKRQSVKVKRTLDRSNLWEIQTPQAFKKDLILEAYERFANLKVTDDASLVEKLGAKVKLVRGSYLNIKITTPEDLILAEAIAKMQKPKCKNHPPSLLPEADAPTAQKLRRIALRSSKSAGGQNHISKSKII